MSVVVVTPPQPVMSLDQVKAQLRVDGGDEDVLIEGMTAAATSHIDGPDGWLGRAIGMQTLEARFDGFDGDGVRLPYPPVVSLVSVKYLNQAGIEQTVAPGSWELIDDMLLPAWGTSWPSAGTRPGAVRVRYQAGYNTLPAPIRAAILLMVGDLWQFRQTAVTGTIGASVPMSTTVKALLAPYRVWR